MKKLNKGIAVLSTIAAALVIAPTVGRAATTMPEAVNGKITLTENVELSATWVNTGNVELDLAGYKITKAPERMYAINNKGTLKITDSSVNKSGMIECTSENITGTVVCVNNFENGSKLTIDGARVQAKVTAVKNNENSILNIINDSKIISLGAAEGRGIAVQNFGTATIKDSYVRSHNGERGYALSTLTYKDFNSATTVENTVLEGKYGIWVYETDHVEGKNPEIKVSLKDVVLNTENLYKKELENATKEVTLEGGIVVLEGKTLVLDENVKLADDAIVILAENSKLENKTSKDILATYVENLDDIDNLDKLETVVVKSNEEIVGKEENFKKEETKEPEKDQTVSKDEEIKVPNTVDGVTTYIIIAIISLLGLGVTVTKLRRN